MTGTGTDLIIIPIVTIISLAVWLILVAYAAAHPSWDRDRCARRHAQAPSAMRASAGDAPSGGRTARPETRHAPAA
jgi:hypothetical protein